MTAAEHPEPHGDGSIGVGRDRPELAPEPTWVGDSLAERRFGSPESIRAALPAEQTADFEQAFGAALDTARRTLRLDELRHVLRMWRRQALLAEQDPEGHRRMLATAAEVTRTGAPRPGSVAWSVVKAELGL